MPSFTKVMLRERLIRDKGLAKSGGGVAMCATYYRQLRALCSGDGSQSSRLIAQDPIQEAKPILINAIVALGGVSSNRAPFSEYLQSARAGARRELVGILNQMLEMRPSLSKGRCQICIDVM
jgi:hypothetical protein